MSATSRRQFVQRGSAIGLSALAYSRLAHAVAEGPRPQVALVGCGGRQKSLFRSFAEVGQITWACDPDAGHAGELKQLSGADNVTGDLRNVLDEKSVDVVVVATPDHWHAPAAIMACNAGKHVYVEKPCSHNFREGELLVAAARSNNVVVQHGTQSRSNPLIANSMQLLHEGVIGEVLMAKAWNIQRRRNIGHAQPSNPPSGVDYDTWVGPAEFMPFQSNRYHYDWHWWHNFGTGDIGNDGAHELDIARWGLGTEGLPATASAIGGKFYFDDDQQFPDTATCVFQWPGAIGKQKQLVFEMRIWSKNLPYNCDTGIEFYGTKGMLFVSKRGKRQIWNDANQLIPSPDEKRTAVARNHQVDFLNCVVDGGRPSADIQIGHDSCSLIHLANISVRLGRSLQVDVEGRKIKGDPQAQSMLGRTYRDGGHWSVPTA